MTIALARITAPQRQGLTTSAKEIYEAPANKGLKNGCFHQGLTEPSCILCENLTRMSQCQRIFIEAPRETKSARHRTLHHGNCLRFIRLQLPLLRARWHPIIAEVCCDGPQAQRTQPLRCDFPCMLRFLACRMRSHPSAAASSPGTADR